MNKELVKFIFYTLKFEEKKFPELQKNQQDILSAIEIFEKQIGELYFDLKNSEIETVFKLSWGEKEEIISKKTIFTLFGLFLKDLINFNLFREVVHELYYKGSLEQDIGILAFTAYKLKEEKSLEGISYLDYLNFMRKLGIQPCLYSTYKKLLEELEINDYTTAEERELSEKIERTVNNINEREQYLDDIVASISTETLAYLDHFLDYSKLSNMAYKIEKYLAKEIEIKEKLPITTIQKKFDEKFKEIGYPTVPIIYDPFLKAHQEYIQAHSVRMDDLAKIPKEYMKEFATKKAYSCHSLAQKITISFLGGGGIGNMAILIQHNNNAILIDYGMSVSNYSIPKWHPALKSVNAILVTHAHLDHTGALPYLIQPEDNKRWYGSINTKLLSEKLLFNTAYTVEENYGERAGLSPFLNNFKKQSSLINFFNVFNPLKPKKAEEISPGFTVTPYNSSHIFGSYGYEIEIYGKKIFFTGDFKLDSCQLFQGAKFPTDADITIFDGTYYNRELTTQDPTAVILEAVERNQKLIIPAFSVGRAQEMYKILERLRIVKDRKVKIIGLAAEIMKLMGTKGDYNLAKSIAAEEFEEGDIVIAGHGMLQGGSARLLLEATKDDSNVGVLLCGYQAPNTLGYALKNSHPIAMHEYGQQTYFAQISGHTSPKRLDEFIQEIKGKKIMVHTPENTKIKKEHKDVVIPNYLQEIKIKCG
ncbi:MAG: MBL fold metallo-hydrolase [Candidatus Heimdallarchaeaceae archaeon]